MEAQTRERIGRIIANGKKVVILSHISPDGDALGSSLGMRHVIACQSDKEVHVIVPNSFPDFLGWLPGASDIVIYEKDSAKAEALLNEADTVICTDFNEPKRIGALGQKMSDVIAEKDESIQVLIIDHHIMPQTSSLPEQDNIVKIINSDSPSASQLVYEALVGDGGNIPYGKDFATCIYTGMMTDTGNFSFNSNHPEMYRIVGELVAAGIDKDAIYNRVFNSWSEGRMRLVGYCLNNKMRVFEEHHTALIYLSGKELYRFNFKSGDAEGIVNMPLSIKDVYYSCFMREDKVTEAEKVFANGSKKKIKISMRSQGDRPVNIFCHDIFNGGGHKNASGGEYYGPLEEAVKLFIDNYAKYFK